MIGSEEEHFIGMAMQAAVIIEDELTISADVHRLDSFRRWSHSDAFPASGRIDYLAGQIEIAMSRFFSD